MATTQSHVRLIDVKISLTKASDRLMPVSSNRHRLARMNCSLEVVLRVNGGAAGIVRADRYQTFLTLCVSTLR